MKKKIFTFNTIFGSFVILYALYMIFSLFSDHVSAFNYKAFFAFLTFLVLGIVVLFTKNQPIEKRRIWLLFWTILIVAFTILIITVVNQKKQIEKLQKMEQPKSIIK